MPDVTPAPSSAADPASVAERLARAAAVLAAAEATAAESAAALAAASASSRRRRPRRESDASAESSALGLAWVDSPDEVPSAPSFADLAAAADDGPPGDAAGGASGGSTAKRGKRSAGPELEPEAAARATVLRQLTMAPRSRAQLERKLSERGCDEEVAARVLDRLTEVGLIDDEAYAQMLVRVRHTDKGLARRALSHELRRHGIDPELADAALVQVGAGDERVRAERLVEKRLRTLHGLAPEVQSRRLAGLLARKGYSSEIAYPVIRDAIAASQEHRRD
ncbi:MAG: regulatory protein RecX [Humibacillus sp.]|nr:regulatory protein RecX [Humibacillus sp.]